LILFSFKKKEWLLKRRPNLMTISERINGAVEAIRARTDRVPELGLILGSGLGDF
jgi:hypothetical protein